MAIEEQISELIDKYESETDRRDQPEADDGDERRGSSQV